MNYKRIVSCICAFCIAGGILPFSQKDAAPMILEASAETQVLELTAIGQSVTIPISSADGTLTETPTWYSDNTNIATVDENGKVTAVGEGSCTIYAVFSSQTLSLPVTVKIPEEETDIIIGDVQLTNEQPAAAITLSVDATGAVWTSSDTSVVTVDNTGVVTAVGSGSCTVTASVGGKNYIINVTSTYVPVTTTPPVTEVILDAQTLSNEIPSGTITFGELPDGTVIQWSSTDESVATVDANGTITAVGSGSCQIIAEINGVKYITPITSTYDPNAVVQKPESVTIGDLQLSNDNPVGKAELNDLPEGTVIEWSSTDESVATAASDGTITAVGSGSCQVYAYYDEVKYIVNVTSTYVPAAEPEISADSAEISGIGNTLQLSVSNTDEKPSWASTNVNVATVDENGLVTAVGEGTVTILATLTGKVLTIEITVRADEGILYGDADLSGDVNINDAVKIMSYVTDSSKYPMTEDEINSADVYQRGDGLSNMDALAVQKKLAQIIPKLPESCM
ncbi:MAG: Ig-like domain-containing protein [Ruminococcus sp.]|nr:Ig-like domain-containing protein [Ruminococcus sp.]